MKTIQYMKGTNKDVPFEHQMLHIVRNYDALYERLLRSEEKRAELRKKYANKLNDYQNLQKAYKMLLEKVSNIESKFEVLSGWSAEVACDIKEFKEKTASLGRGI